MQPGKITLFTMWASCFYLVQLLHELCTAFRLASWIVSLSWLPLNVKLRRLPSPLLCHSILEKPIPAVVNATCHEKFSLDACLLKGTLTQPSVEMLVPYKNSLPYIEAVLAHQVFWSLSSSRPRPFSLRSCNIWGKPRLESKMTYHQTRIWCTQDENPPGSTPAV